MDRRNSTSRITRGLALSALLVSAGCHHVPHGASSAGIQSCVPPLSTRPGCAEFLEFRADRAGSNFAYSSSVWQVPPPPESNPSSAAREASGDGFIAPALPPGGPASTGAAQQAGHVVAGPAGQAASCVPQEEAWRRDLEQQNAQLQQRVAALDQELGLMRETLKTMNEALVASQAELTHLNRDVVHWQGEVRRLEGEMRSQQQSDLKSLDELSLALGRLLQEKQPGNRERAP